MTVMFEVFGGNDGWCRDGEAGDAGCRLHFEGMRGYEGIRGKDACCNKMAEKAANRHHRRWMSVAGVISRVVRRDRGKRQATPFRPFQETTGHGAIVVSRGRAADHVIEIRPKL